MAATVNPCLLPRADKLHRPAAHSWLYGPLRASGGDEMRAERWPSRRSGGPGGRRLQTAPSWCPCPELSTDVAAPAHQRAAEVIRDDVGIRCVTPSTARQLIAQRDAAEVTRKAAFAADYAASSSWLPALIDEVLASSRLPAGVHGGPEVAVVDLADASPEVVA